VLLRDSHFLHGLILTRADADRRYTLRNAEFAVHHCGGTERQALADAARMRQALEGVFDLCLPDAPELDPILDRLTGAGERVATRT
jgi:N-hydroxyarylamine O-acetyltransferase